VTGAAVEVDGLSKRFRLYHERNQSLKATVLRGGRSRFDEKWALRDVSFEIAEGSTYGLIGDNGSGKSTLLKCLARILVPDEGSSRVHGKIAALLELGSGFHPELTGRQNVFLNGAILGMSRKELERRFDDIVGFAGLEHAIDQPVKNYSSGMYVRLGFSVATNVDPEVLLVDEVLAVGDATFQRKCMERINGLRDSGATIVIVSHAAESVRMLCDEVAWLEQGRLMEAGPANAVVDRYLRAGVEERSDVVGDPDRSGSGDVVIDSVDLLDKDGRTTTKASTGDALHLRVHWRAQGGTSPGAFGLAIFTPEGQRLWGANTVLQEMELGGVTGSGSIDYRAPRLALQPGVYDIDVAVTDKSTAKIYDRRRKILRFDVQPGDSRETGGYLSLAGRFEQPVLHRPGRGF
jgi:ABC-type polysaccharide/polyol phosphate transport system ATPase subunit